MVLRFQASGQIIKYRFSQKASFKKIEQIFNGYFLLKKKSPIPGVGFWAFAPAFPFQWCNIQAAVVSSFSILKLLANDRNFVSKDC